MQKLYNISDEQTEYQILDRISFLNFLGLSSQVPDARTIWKFRETLTKAGIIKDLFNLFNKQIVSKNLITREGSIVDASFVEVPRQGNTRDENSEIKNGNTPETWENKNMIRQKDTQARWTVKRGIAHFGYKNHIKADIESKIITNYEVTSANIHDSQVIEKLVDETAKNLK